jgi:hypothetical protein
MSALLIKRAYLGRKLVKISKADAAAGVTAGRYRKVAFRTYREVSGGGSTAPTLKDLSITNKAGSVGAAFDSNVVDASTGSTIEADPTTPVPAGVTFDGVTRQFSGMPSAAGSFPMKLIETLAGAVGSPKTTDVGPIVIAAAAPPAPPVDPAPPADPVPCDPPVAPSNGKNGKAK